jgi:hypothetical protein
MQIFLLFFVPLRILDRLIDFAKRNIKVGEVLHSLDAIRVFIIGSVSWCSSDGPELGLV